MTAIETRIENNVSIELKVGDVFSSNGKTEMVTETHYEGEKLMRFRTARRDDGGIAESGYSVNRTMGRVDQSYSGIFYRDDSHPPFHASARYDELNEFLEKYGK